MDKFILRQVLADNQIEVPLECRYLCVERGYGNC